jgi:hypothetical protein
MLFALAGLAEVGGGYLVWLWWRDGRPWPVGLLGGITLVLYGIIPTYQAAHFGRVQPTGACSSCCPCCGGGPSTASGPTGTTCSAP